MRVGRLVDPGRRRREGARAEHGDNVQGASAQVSEVIRIPARCVVRIVELDEPSFTSSAPSSRPVKGRERRAF